MVRIFSAFSRIRTEYEEIRSISTYPVQVWENAGKMRTRITLNTDSFYAVIGQNAFGESDCRKFKLTVSLQQNDEIA